jgi:ectoine hydroxylase-related dioxygenase (phytanoyl-CoA dioxygenase family)
LRLAPATFILGRAVTTTHHRALLERGYTVVENTHGEAQLTVLRDSLERIHRAHGSPRPHASPEQVLTRNVIVNPTGFVVFELLAVAPEVASCLVSPALVDVVRALLGPDMHLELTGGSISDASRPFFSWHNHIGGIDVEAYRDREAYPRFERSQRVIAVVYLDDIDAAGGELLVLPRKITDPTAPPGDRFAPTWEGEVVVHLRRGSTLLLEQCTWHAVRPCTRSGLRMFVGAYFASSEAPPTQLRDSSLPGFRGGGLLLQSVLPRPSSPG